MYKSIALRLSHSNSFVSYGKFNYQRRFVLRQKSFTRTLCSFKDINLEADNVDIVNRLENVLKQNDKSAHLLIDNELDSEREYEELVCKKAYCKRHEVDINEFFKKPTDFAVNPSAYSNVLSKIKKFKDRVKVKISAGNGGRGCASFYRDRKVMKGPPNGGDGGKGGDVIIKASSGQKLSLNTIDAVYTARSGQSGKPSKSKGKDGESIIIEVPLGTIVTPYDKESKPVNINDEDDDSDLGMEEYIYEDETKENPFASLVEDSILRYEIESSTMKEEENIEENIEETPVVHAPFKVSLEKDGDFYVAARGGRGGLGNWRLANVKNRPINVALPGLPGEQCELLLELKMIADVGLVGYPNAGKSTFLASISRAKPKIGSYPFTTLTPQIGTVIYDDGTSITISDLPGLISGAHLNKGLGHNFLRHVERTSALVYLIDMAAVDGKDPWEAFTSLRYELEKYQPGLSSKGSLIIANKMDLDDAHKNLQKFVKKLKSSKLYNSMLVFPTSTMNGVNIEAILMSLKHIVAHVKGEKVTEEYVPYKIDKLKDGVVMFDVGKKLPNT